jgi:DNA-binding TFAR19-related protein (PDSD5 family)
MNNLKKIQNDLKEQIKLQQQISALENIAKQYMTNEAISRYGNLKSAHLELAIQVIAIIAQGVQMGQIKEKINDEQFKDLLMRIQKPKREIKIQRK